MALGINIKYYPFFLCCVIQLLLLLFFKIIICRNVLKTLSPEETRMQQNPDFSRKANY